jgi:hypothetical protein
MPRLVLGQERTEPSIILQLNAGFSQVDTMTSIDIAARSCNQERKHSVGASDQPGCLTGIMYRRAAGLDHEPALGPSGPEHSHVKHRSLRRPATGGTAGPTGLHPLPNAQLTTRQILSCFVDIDMTPRKRPGLRTAGILHPCRTVECRAAVGSVTNRPTSRSVAPPLQSLRE